MDSALNVALERAQEAGAKRVNAVRLRIGALSGVVPEALEFAFETLKQGTIAQEAQLAIEHIPARFWCEACDLEFQADSMFAECPHCHEASDELRAGREMELASLDIE